MKPALIIIPLLFLFVATQAQSSDPTLVPVSDTEICRGYNPLKNIAQVGVSVDIPDYVMDRSDMFVTYKWRAEHPNGNKVWNTSQAVRTIPIPWTGEYTIKCTVEYVLLGNSTPFETVESNTLTITGKSCQFDSIKKVGEVDKKAASPLKNN